MHMQDADARHSADYDAAQFATNAKIAQDLREKAQQLANDELLLMNQAVDLNLLAKQLAEATMKPRPTVHPVPPVPISLFLPGGLNNAAIKQMQLMRAQALSTQQQCPSSSSNPVATLPQNTQAATATTAQQPTIAGDALAMKQDQQRQQQHLQQIGTKIAAATVQPYSRRASPSGQENAPAAHVTVAIKHPDVNDVSVMEIDESS